MVTPKYLRDLAMFTSGDTGLADTLRNSADRIAELEAEVKRLQTPEPHTRFIPESAHLEHLASGYASGYHAGWNDCRRQVRKLIEADKDSGNTAGGGDE